MDCASPFPGPRGNRSGDFDSPPPIPPKRGALIGLFLVLATLLGALAIGQAVWS